MRKSKRHCAGLAKAIQSEPKPSQDAGTHGISSSNLPQDSDKEKVAIAAISLQQKMTEIETKVVEGKDVLESLNSALERVQTWASTVSRDPIGIVEDSLFSSMRVNSNGIERSQSDLATFILDLCHPP